jgi:hypothetical protein
MICSQWYYGVLVVVVEMVASRQLPEGLASQLLEIKHIAIVV